MKLIDNIRYSIKHFLQLDEQMHSPEINQVNNSNIYQKYLLYEAWSVGDEAVLSNVYKNLPDSYRYSFWKVVPNDAKFCKRHAGIPKMILDALTNIITENYNGIVFNEKEKEKEIWKEIEKDNKFTKIVRKSIRDDLIFGEGAYKLMFLPDVSKYPVIEFVPAKQCDIDIEYGRVKEIVFFNNVYFDEHNNKYTLKEYYKKGCIEYKLFDENDKEVLLTTIPETAEIENIYFSDPEFIAAEAFIIFESDQYEGHGESIFSGGKTGIFDMIDEIVSLSSQTVRLSPPKLYVPDDCFDTDLETGNKKISETIYNPVLTKPITNPNIENPKIELVQSALNSESYGKALSQAILIACSGILSPSTMAFILQSDSLISSDSGEAQREKEKQTLYTINKIKNALYETIPSLVVKTIKLYSMIYNKKCDIEEDDITIDIAEYANPSFESIIETIKKACPELTILTTEAITNELFGYTMNEEEAKKYTEQLNIINYGVRNIDELLEKKAIQENQEKAIQQNNQEDDNLSIQQKDEQKDDNMVIQKEK